MSGGQRWLYPLLLGCCTLIFSNQLLDYYHHSRFLALSLFVVVFAAYQLFRTQTPQIRITPIGIALLSFVLYNGISIVWANEKSEALFNAAKWMLTFSLYYLFYQQYRRLPPERLLPFVEKTSRWFTAAILIIVWYSLFKIITQQGFSNESLYELKILFGHKSLISTFIFLLLPFNLIHDYRGLFKGSVLVLVLVQIMTIILLQSRAVYGSLFLFLLIAAIYLMQTRKEWINPVRSRYLYMVLAFLVVGTFILARQEGFRDRLNVATYLKSQTATERQDVWRLTKPLIREHWVLGVGGGNWKIEFPANGIAGSYRMQDQNVFFTRAHNDFLEIWAELGIGGLLIYLLLFGSVLAALHRHKNIRPWPSRMLLAGILGFAVSSLLDFPKERPEFLAVFATYLAMVDLIFSQKKGLKMDARYPYGIILLCMSLQVYMGVMRYQGERMVSDLLRERLAGNWSRVLKLGAKSENPFYHLDPYSVPIKYYMGLAHYQSGDRDEAAKAFSEAHTISPYNFHVLNNLATVALDRKDYINADLWLNEALRINPRFEDALYNLSYSHAAQGRFAQALETLNSVPSDSDRKELFREEILKLQNAAK